MKCASSCKWMYDEPSAGLIHYCGNEEMTDEENERYKIRRESDCPYYELDGKENNNV